MVDRSFRFGASEGERFSQHWKIAATATRPELVLSGSRSGSFFHATMHEDPRYWHLKIKLPSEEIERPWQPPREVLPGVRRLVRLILPLEATRYDRPRKAAKVKWFPAPPDEQQWVEFTILHCTRGRPEIASAVPLGGVTLADGSEAMVIARAMAAQPDSTTFTVPDPEEVKRQLRQPDVGLLVHGTNEDGCIWFLSLFSSSRNALEGQGVPPTCLSRSRR